MLSGHANARELQLMINLLRPQYLFPIQGEYRDLQAHAELALEVGILPENIYIVKRGDIMHLSEDQGFLHEGAVPAGDVMIDGNAIGDVGNIVLRDRKVLSEDGIFIVAITVNKKERLSLKARVNTRGFVYMKKSRDILREAADIVNATVENYLAGDSFTWGELKGRPRRCG